MNNIIYAERACHVTDIRVGDIVLHDGLTVTVGKDDIKRSFMGTTFRGDSYRLGTKPVIKLIATVHYV